mgnify:FL=1
MIFILTQISEVSEILGILNHAKPLFVFLALILILVWIATLGFSYFVIYRLVGIKESYLHMVTLSSAAINFVGIVTPSAGISTLLLLISDAKEKCISSARVTFACMLYLLFDYFALFITALVGLLILQANHQLTWLEIAATCLLGGIIGGLVLVLFLSSKHLDLLKKILGVIFQTLNRIIRIFSKKTRISDEQITHFAEEIHIGSQTIHNNFRLLFLPVSLAFVNKALLILILSSLFLAFGLAFDLGVVISGFTLGYLFTIISPTPSGIGVMEGMMTLALNTLGVELESAAILTLAFRAITFWIPFFGGMVAFRTLLHKQKKPTL